MSAPFATAWAQTAPQVTPAPVNDRLGADGVYVEADAATRTNDIITATGTTDNRAYVRTRGHVLRGESLSYDLAQGTAAASGQVEAIAPDGSVLYARQIELDPELQLGVAVDLASRLENGASIMAATAVRRSERVNELNYVIFTPCPICDDDGPKTPSVSIQAERVVQDETLRAVLYRNAVFRIGGVPVFYTPFFAHPDPSVERASGFLTPSLNYDEGRGVSIEVPYLHVVSPSEDWLISPQVNARVAPLLNLQWRRRFAAGTIVARGGYTYEKDFGDFDRDGDGSYETNIKFGDREHRGYLLAYGAFDPDGPWRYGFTAERTSDETLFDRYDVREPYQDNGLYYGDRRRLISQVYAERQTDRSYLSVAAFSIQSLRLDPAFEDNDFRDEDGFPAFEDDDTLPLVAPLVEARWEPAEPVFGGRLRLRGSAVSLYRDAFLAAPLNPSIVPTVTDGLPGVDSRRISGQVEWRRTVIAPNGLRWEPFADLRADAYSIADLPPMMGMETDETLIRSRLSAGIDVSYPLIRRTGSADIILEPLAQLSLSNDAETDPRIPNEDSQAIELDQFSLFRMDRFPGYDLVEGGLRLTAGGRATIRWTTGRSASLFVGRSYRADEEPDFLRATADDATTLYDPSGLASRTSDWVVQADFEPSDRIRGWTHATIDGSGEIHRAEAAIDGRWGRRNLATVSYIIDRSDPVQINDQPNPDDPMGPLIGSRNRNYEFVQLAGQQFIYGNWGLTAAGIADLREDRLTRSEVGVLFDDDCFRFELGYRRDNTRVRATGATGGIYVRLNLATFGGSGYGQSEQR